MTRKPAFKRKWDKTHMLLVGASDDPLVAMLQTEAREAGHTVSLYLDGDEEEFYLTNPKRSFSALMVLDSNDPHDVLLEMPDFVWSRCAGDCLFLINALCTSATDVTPFFQEDETDRIIGFSPVALYAQKPVVEISKGELTAPDAMESAKLFFDSMSIQTVDVPDIQGLVLGRILAMLVNEAASALMEGVASVEDIDAAMKLGVNYPEGPLAWGDKIGLDVIRDILLNLFSLYGERYMPMPLLNDKVDAGQLGYKTRQGFYTYRGTHAKKGHLTLIKP